MLIFSSECLSSKLAKQKLIVNDLLCRKMVKGDLWLVKYLFFILRYILSLDWWRKWECYVNETNEEFPGKVDNRSILGIYFTVLINFY